MMSSSLGLQHLSQYFEISFEEIGNYSISLHNVTWWNYWYSSDEFVPSFYLLISNFSQLKKNPKYVNSLMEIRKAVNMNDYHHLWKSVKIFCQNNNQKKNFLTLRKILLLFFFYTNDASSTLSIMHMYIASEKKGASPIPPPIGTFWHLRLFQ